MPKLSLLSLLLFTSSAQAAWWIQDISASKPEEIKIHRNGQDLPARLLMPLHTGDVLNLPEDTSLRLIQDNQTERKLTAQDSPFTVPDTAPPPTLWGNVLASLRDWFSKKMAQPTVVVSATSRSDGELAWRGAPYLPPLQLHPGHAQLRLYWQGGTPPYALRLDDAQGNRVAQRDNLQQTLADLPLVLSVAEVSAVEAYAPTCAYRHQVPTSLRQAQHKCRICSWRYCGGGGCQAGGCTNSA